MPIPFLDLKTQYELVKADIELAALEVLSSGSYILGPKVEAFERELAEYCGVGHAVAVASGTDALVLILDALGVGRGDEVITTPFTFFATAESISRVGAIPVFADIDPSTYNINPEAVRAALTDKTKAIMPVHLYGQLAQVDELNGMAAERGIPVIEDACQAIGAAHGGKRAGSLGAAAAFSFYPTKNLGGVGDGGAVTTNDGALAERIKLLRDHGSPKRYFHSVLGYNSRLDAIQAVVLSIKLKYLDGWNAARRARAALYSSLLEPLGVGTPRSRNPEAHVFHQYTSRVTANRDELVKEVNSAGIACGVYYPLPLHLQDVYRGLGYDPGSLPEAERASRQVFSLPMYPELTDVQVQEVAGAVKSALERVGG